MRSSQFNPDITDWQQRPGVTNHLLQIHVKCFPDPVKKPLTQCLNSISSSTKSLKCLLYSERKVLLPNLKSLFSMMTVWSMNPFKQLSGPMFGESPRLTSSLISDLVFSDSWKQQFIRKSHLKSHPMHFKKSSNKLTCYSSISFFLIKKKVLYFLTKADR